MLRAIFKKRFELPVWASFLLLFAGSAGLTAVMLWLQPNGMPELIKCIRDSRGLMPILNFLPIFFAMLGLYFLLGSAAFSGGLTAFAVIVLSIANRLKMLYRFDPLMPWDFLLGGEVVGISRSFSPKLIAAVVGGIIAMMILVGLGAWFVRSKPMKLAWRLAGFVACAVILFITNKTLLSDYKINRELPVVGNVYNQMNQFNAKGFIYQFLFTYNTGKIQKPDGYDPAVAAALNNEAVYVPENQKRPHVFLILGEAFSEIATSPALSFEGYNDPLSNYKRIKAEADWGTLIVPNMGGGTADTEFDMLTGINTRQFRGVPYANLLVTKTMHGMPAAMADCGYETLALHPGYGWFYNRQNVFKFLGFSRFVSQADFPGAEEKGSYISEKATFDKVLADFESHLAEKDESPLFDFVITIQNHGPYPDKYGENTPVNFNADAEFSKEDENALANYLLGLADMDAELGHFIAEMEKTDEPVVVAYFGDHLPLLSSEAYDVLIPPTGDEDDDQLRLHKTPYFIWANNAAKPLLNPDARLANGDTFASFYFGAALMDYVYAVNDPFFARLNAQRPQLPAVLEREYQTPDGKLHDMAAQPDETANLYRQWAYWRVFQK